MIDQLPPITTDRFWDFPLKIFLAALVICLLAPIEIHITSQIPVTLQTLVILSLSMILGGRCGLAAVGLYLVFGFMGLPVFAGGSSGIDKLMGPTGGFLLSFLPAAWLVGRMSEDRWGQTWLGIGLSMLTGHLLILVLGFGWLGLMRGFSGLMEFVYPLLPGLYLKIIFGTLIVGGINALLRYLLLHKHRW